jgi:hypothetical protein
MNTLRKYFKSFFNIMLGRGLFEKVFLLLIIPFSLNAQLSFDVRESLLSATYTTPTITGPDTACAGIGGYIYFTEPGMTNYIWVVSAGGNITTGEGTNSITVTWNLPGSQTVSVNYNAEPIPGEMNVTVQPVLPVGITISASANPSCSGSQVIFSAATTNGGSSPIFQWEVNGVPVGTNSPNYTYFPANGDNILCQLTSNATCISGNPATSNTITMTVIPTLPVSVSIAASANPVCQNIPVTYTATGSNGGSVPFYQWKVNGSNSGTNSSTFSYIPVNGDVVTCVMTSNASCTSGNPATSNAITMTVSPALPVSVSIAASSNPVCPGSLVNFTATPVNGGFSPAYEWKVNGNIVGSNSPTYSYIPVNGDQVICKLISSTSCSTGNPAISNTISMVVNASTPVSISISASANPVCQGPPVTFTAVAINGGPSPVYHWAINGFPVGTNSPTYSYLPANGDIVTCQVTSSLACASGNPANSNPIMMTVNLVQPVSVSITASVNPVCQSLPVTLTATPINGGSAPVYSWSVNGIVTGTNNASYSYVPLNGDVVSCVMTSSAPCTSGNPAVSNAITLTVSPEQPVGVSITASINPVCQNTQVTFTAAAINGGSSPVYQWKVNGINAGSNNAVFSYIPLDGDIVTCQMTSSATCLNGNPANSNPITVSVIQSQSLPVSISIAPSSNPSCMGLSVTFTSTAINEGTSPVYQWMVNGLNVGSNSPTFSYIPTNGDFVKCMLTSSLSCALGNPAFSNQISMTVIPNLAVSVSIVASANPTCVGTSITYTATAINGGSSPVFQWKVNGVNTGTNQNTYSYVPVNGNVVTCQLTSSVPCPVSNPVTSNAITMSVLPILPVGISISTMTNPSCTGSQVTFTATSSNGGTSPHYLWKKNGINAGSDSPYFVYIPVNGDVINCQLTSNTICYTGSRIVLSNSITMIVSDAITPGISIGTSANPFCQGTPVTFTATPTNGGTAPVYQWKVNCVNVGTNNPVYTYTPADGDFITCRMTSNLVCAVQNPTTSNAITMKKNTSAPVSVSVAASSNPFCQGTSVTFTATPVNGGTAPFYQWKKNGVNVGTNSATYSYYPSNNDIVTCTLTSNAACASGSPAISNPVSMVSSLALPVSISITTPTNPFCQGSFATFTATAINGGSSPIYQWLINGINVGMNGPTFSYYPSNGDIVTCLLTSNLACATGNPALSNAITMIASTSLPVGISITSSATTLCQGSPVTFTATAVNGGNNPVYQWKVNNINAGTNLKEFSCFPANGDVITCQLTSDLGCATGNPALSNSITMTVNPVLPVSVTITVSSNPCCQGTPVTFTAAATNGGTAPVYQWRVNCVNVGTNNSSFTYTPINGDVVVCQLTSNETCTSGSPAISNNINMIVLPVMPVSVSITASANPFCIGEPVTFTATDVNGGTAPGYQWIVNNVNVGTNDSTYTYSPVNGDIVKCKVTSNGTCVSGNPAMSDQMIMISSSTLPVTISITSPYTTICHGTFVTFTATTTNGGTSPVYQWKVNGLNAGTNSSVYTYDPDNGDVITCQLVTNLSCATPNPAISNPITMTVNPQLPVSVNVVASANPSCVGNTVCYTATVINGGTTPFYSWRVNGSIVGPNNPTYCYVPLNGDVIYCRVVSNATCAIGNPSNSNSITMTVSPVIPANVSISATANPVCQGTSVTFTAVPVNGGTAPVYQWKVNGINSGTNSATFSYIPVNGDVVKCEMTSNSPCATVTFVSSNTITMTVSPNQPVSISISASSNPTCIGNLVTFTAIPINGGSIPVFQWKVNGINAGTNSAIYTYTPVNGDVVTCQLTSNATCTSGNPASSNPITMIVSQSLPVSIGITSSANTVCLGQMVSFTATSVNGGPDPTYQWMVNGINVGTNNPTYSYYPSNSDFITCRFTSSFSCGTGNPAISNQISMTVNPILPVNVSITSSANPVCDGTTVTFTAAAINGGSAPVYQWMVNGINVGTNTPAYSYVPLTRDSVTCLLTSNAACPINNPVTSNAILMNVLEALTPGISITASNNPACIGSPVTFSAIITNGGSAPVFQWKVNGMNAGANLPNYTYIPLSGDIITCHLTTNAPCVNENTVISNQVVMTVSSELPVSVTINASSNPACLGQIVIFTATPVNQGTIPMYQWIVNGIYVGTNSPVYSYSPSNGDVINCLLTSDLSCATGNPTNSNQISMVVNSNFPVSVFITASVNPVCLGSSVTYTAAAINGGASPVYQWKVNGVNTGNNLPDFSYIPANGDIVTCQFTSDLICANGNPATSNQIIMVVGTDLPTGIMIAASANPVCPGGIPITYSATATNGGSAPVYQWKVNGINEGTNNPVFTYTPLNGDVVTCLLTSSLSCATGNPATSNTIIMSVNSNYPASVTITTNPIGEICEGTTVAFTAIAMNGGPAPVYQWYKNGLLVGSNQPVYTCVPVNGDQVHAVMTSNLPCVSGNPATSNTIVMIVNPPLPVSVSVAASTNNVCEGTTVTFTGNAINGGSTPVYQWYKNSVPVGSNQSTYSCVPVNGDQVHVVMTSNLSCVSGNPATSNTVVMVVNPVLPVSVSIAASTNNVCEGTTVTFTGNAINGGSAPVYQWYKNSVPVGSNQSTYSCVPVNGDQVHVVMTSNLSCVSGNPATSNTVVMVVNPVLPVSVSIAASTNNVCEGTTVTFTGTAVNGGSTPVYQWYKNSLPVGSNQSTYSCVPVNGDQVHVVMTSNLSCVSGNPATSNTVVMVVNTMLPVSVSIAASTNNVCEGTAVTFTGTAINGGSAPVYQWYKNSVPVGSNQSTYSCVPVNGDQVQVVMTSNLPCVSGNPATSNTVVMVVNPVLPVSVSIAASTNNVCEGTTVTFTGNAINGGSAPVYQWYKNSVPVGSNQSTYSCVPVNGDQVHVVMTSNLSCVSGNPATSNTVVMVVNPVLPVSVSIAASTNNVCEGTTVTFTGTAINGGSAPVYQWYKNSVLVGSNQSTYSCVAVNGDQVHVVMTSNLPCVSGNPATSNTVVMVVNPMLPVSVSIAADQNNVCEGTTATFTGIAINGGSAPVYQWYKNSVPVGSNQSTYSCVPVNGDQVYVVMTSELTCVTGNPATSNIVSMVVNPLLPVSVSVAADQNNVCEGTTVTFTGTAINGGSAPVYQWYKNSLPVGSNQSTYSCIPVNGDQVYVVMTSDLTCVTGNPATSNIVSMVVILTPAIPMITLNGQLLQSSSPVGNQWYFEGNIIAGATDQTYIATQTGWYWTVVTLDGCSSDTSNHIYVLVVGIEEKPEAGSFYVYPIPNNGRFNISIRIHSEETFTIGVYNDLGQRIYELNDLLVKGSFDKMIDLRPLAAGMYSVVFYGNNIKIVKRIIVHNK